MDLKIINPEKSSAQIDLLEYIDSLEYIHLENNNNALLSWVDKLVVTDDLFVLKCRNRSSVFLYKKNGTFFDRINVIGKGPLEFSNVQDIAVQDSILFISDLDRAKILKYNLKTNEIFDEYLGKKSPYFTIFSRNGKIFSISNDFENGKIEIIDFESKKVISQAVKEPLYLNLITTPYCIRNINDTIIYNISFTDTIYKSIGEKIHPYAILKNEAGPLSEKITHEYVNEYLHNFQLKNETDHEILIPRGFLSIYENLFFIELVWENSMVIWDRFQNKSYRINFSNFKNRDLLFGYQLFKLNHVDDNGFCYSAIIPSELFFSSAEQLLENEKVNFSIKNAIKKIVNEKDNILKSENPIIIKFKLNTSFFDFL